jgi:hypothetical protein
VKTWSVAKHSASNNNFNKTENRFSPLSLPAFRARLKISNSFDTAGLGIGRLKILFGPPIWDSDLGPRFGAVMN